MYPFEYNLCVCAHVHEMMTLYETRHHSYTQANKSGPIKNTVAYKPILQCTTSVLSLFVLLLAIMYDACRYLLDQNIFGDFAEAGYLQELSQFLTDQFNWPDVSTYFAVSHIVQQDLHVW